jgi:hypothetical protein
LSSISPLLVERLKAWAICWPGLLRSGYRERGTAYGEVPMITETMTQLAVGAALFAPLALLLWEPFG